jgi:quinate dehydrogenase
VGLATANIFRGDLMIIMRQINIHSAQCPCVRNMCGQKYYYLAGKGVKHSIAPSVHQTVADELGLPWTFKLLDSDSIEEVIAVFRRDDFAGGVVTMPYKKSIIPYLDELDDIVRTLGSCNNVYLGENRKLVGSNTDWLGILGCLTSMTDLGRGKPAMIIGAGGASRAAIYALFSHLDCKTIYLINRDDQEVVDLSKDAEAYGDVGPTIIHIKTKAEATELSSPTYIVSAVPDIEPRTESEIEAAEIVQSFLRSPTLKGAVLDMCFNPRKTRLLKAAKEYGWQTVEGIDVIGYQLDQQYKLWAGEEREKVPHEKAWEALRKAADSSPYIN